ncbi:LysR family transcriptional regulator [Thalassotalea fusca]
MDINSLRSFVLFAEYGSLNKVANARHKTNAAISAQMKKLSEIYDIQLFERNGRNLTLSTDGENFLDVARCILSFHDKVVANIKNNTAALPVSIGIPSDYVGTYLLTLLKYLSDSLDKIRFELVVKPSKELYELWQSKAIDITIYSAEFESSEGVLIAESQGEWFASKNYQADLQKPLNIALYDDSCLFHQQAVKGLIEKGTVYNIHSTTSDSRTICELVENFNVVAAMSRISKTDGMKKVEDARLPPLPTVYIKLLLSEKLAEVNTSVLVNVLKPIATDGQVSS